MLQKEMNINLVINSQRVRRNGGKRVFVLGFVLILFKKAEKCSVGDRVPWEV